MRISYWSSDVCSSDLHKFIRKYGLGLVRPGPGPHRRFLRSGYLVRAKTISALAEALSVPAEALEQSVVAHNRYAESGVDAEFGKGRSEEHTSELQSLMRTSYAAFLLRKKNIDILTSHTM